MDQEISLTNTVTGLSENFDDLLEALSILHRLGALPAYKLTEETLLKEVLKIIYDGCKTTSCTVITWSTNDTTPTNTSLQTTTMFAIDSNGIGHRRVPTKIEALFIGNAITHSTTQHGSDCTTLGEQYQEHQLEKSIISVPIYNQGKLTGVLTVSHSDRDHFNNWCYQLMETFNTFLGQQLTICRQQ